MVGKWSQFLLIFMYKLSNKKNYNNLFLKSEGIQEGFKKTTTKHYVAFRQQLKKKHKCNYPILLTCTNVTVLLKHNKSK